MSRGHHILFERELWSATQTTRALRTKPGLHVPMDRSVEDELHKNIACVPVPNDALGRSILHYYHDNPNDHIDSMYNLMHATQDAMTRPQVKKVEFQLGSLIIISLEAQMPYIKEGIYHAR